MWGAAQVINAYDSLARLIHGEPVSLEGADDEEMDELDEEAGLDTEEADDVQGRLWRFLSHSCKTARAIFGPK